MSNFLNKQRLRSTLCSQVAQVEGCSNESRSSTEESSGAASRESFQGHQNSIVLSHSQRLHSAKQPEQQQAGWTQEHPSSWLLSAACF